MTVLAKKEDDVVSSSANWLDDEKVEEFLKKAAPDPSWVREILAKARTLRRLDLEETAALMKVDQPQLLDELFEAAKQVKNEIYGTRIVLFAPLYISNICSNACVYCAFRKGNVLKRRALSQEQIADEIEALVNQGHKRVLLLAGEDGSSRGFRYVLEAIRTVYQVKVGNGEIRRVNVNIAPLSVARYRELKQVGIGTYQLFQETYHRSTYHQVHPSGPKRDFYWRVTAMDRAMEGGIDDVGIGPLLGLYNWRFEVLAMLQHIEHLERRFGVGPHTISVPRMEPAAGSQMASHPPHPVSDSDFLKLVAILRLAVPYTGIIMSTRETPEMRRKTLEVGVSQISGGSRVDIGGYAEETSGAEGQFLLGDHRTLDEVVRDLADLGYIPSFCTACYRKGRTGQDFMDLAKPGDIKTHCQPNALSTFLEYLLDYASPETSKTGAGRIDRELGAMQPHVRAFTSRMLEKIRKGKRDIFI